MKYPVKVVPKITSKKEKAHKKKSYSRAHQSANKAEIEHFGKKQFNYIKNKIQQLPKDHWIGTHTPQHHIHISQEFFNLIPKNKQKSVKSEIILHEITEDKLMSKV